MASVFGIILLFTAMTSPSLDVVPGKQIPKTLTVQVDDGGTTSEVNIPFLLFVPDDYRSDGQPMPLLLFLHGFGESGDGSNLDLVKVHGPPKLVESRPDFPFIVVSPQCPRPRDLARIPAAWRAEQLIQLVDELEKQLNVDKDRVYVTGLSMGGFGTWRLAARYPDRFAAAIPICGGGEPKEMAEDLIELPVWAFHGARDNVVPPSTSQDMVDAIRAAGGEPRLTMYLEATHDSWSQTYANDAVFDWLLTQRRSDRK